jgi:hypothetical protein
MRKPSLAEQGSSRFLWVEAAHADIDPRPDADGGLRLMLRISQSTYDELVNGLEPADREGE